MCEFALKERKKHTELWELLRLEPVSLMINVGRLRRFCLVEIKDCRDWVKQCMLREIKGTSCMGCPTKDLVG